MSLVSECCRPCRPYQTPTSHFENGKAERQILSGTCSGNTRSEFQSNGDLRIPRQAAHACRLPAIRLSVIHRIGSILACDPELDCAFFDKAFGVVSEAVLRMYLATTSLSRSTIGSLLSSPLRYAHI